MAAWLFCVLYTLIQHKEYDKSENRIDVNGSVSYNIFCIMLYKWVCMRSAERHGTGGVDTGWSGGPTSPGNTGARPTGRAGERVSFGILRQAKPCPEA